MEERDLLSKIAISKDGKELGKIASVKGKDGNFHIFKKEQIDIELTQHLSDNSFQISVLACDIAQVDARKVWLDITKEEFDRLVGLQLIESNHTDNSHEEGKSKKSKILKRFIDPE